jgi:hypothetical protein
METGGRWSSMADINRAKPTTPSGSQLHRSLVDIRVESTLAAEDLLDHGSPASCGLADPTLLDDDSDGNTEARDNGNDGNTVTPMTVDSNATGDTIEDPLYHQCRTARRTSYTDKLVSVSGDGTFGSFVSSQSPPIGNLTDHPGFCDTFHGSRIRSGTEIVNQSVSMSFDPSKLLCVTCKTEHPILGKKPTTVFFSDQNFITGMEGSNNSCLNVVLMEDTSLSDLCRLSVEIFGNVRLPEGSVLMFGSASYLARIGTGVYAKDWLALIANMEKTFLGVRICPLIPLILSDCPGFLARKITEMAAWLAVVYDNNPDGMLELWTAVAVATDKLSVGSVTLPNMDTYKVSLPQHYLPVA